jgi:hypothetical protein
MQYCPKCKIQVRGRKECCPLCQGPLSGEPEEGESAFPVIAPPRVSRVTFFRLCTFILLAFEAGMLITAYMVRDAAWPGVAGIAALLAWADLWITLYFRNNVMKLINVQFYIFMIVLLFFCNTPGRTVVILSFMLPVLFVLLAVITLISGHAAHLAFEVYAIYLLLDIVLSFLQVIPILKHTNPLPLPALISMSCMFLLGAAAVLFRPRELKRASGKWLHL